MTLAAINLGAIDVVIIFVFFACVVTVGLLKSKRKEDSEDYFLAGRGLSWWLIGFSLIAANISAEQFVGMSGQASKDSIGLAVASYEWIAAVTLVVVAFFFLPKFLGKGIFTIPEYLEHRYSHQSRLVMSFLMVLIYAGVTIPCVIYLGAKALDPLFQGGGTSFLGIPVNMTSLSWFVGILAAVYVVAGGLRAVAWADLIQGSALIVGGAIIMVLTLMALGDPAAYNLPVDKIDAGLGLGGGSSLWDRLAALREKKMHMVLPADASFLPWTALVIGIWIPNFYYWGLNQYIMQRTLGARSLREGQKGTIFAAFMKLIIPFIVCIPGIIAFTLYKPQMHEQAMSLARKNVRVLQAYEQHKDNPAASEKLFPFDGDFDTLEPGISKDMFTFNVTAAAAKTELEIAADASLAEKQNKVGAYCMTVDQKFAEKIEKLVQEEIKKAGGEGPGMEGKVLSGLGLAELNNELVSVATGTYRSFWDQIFGESYPFEKGQKLEGYDHDSAFPLLISNLAPTPLKGLVLAALLGAVISSLASMLNGGSTMFTMDIYREWFNKKAEQKQLVIIGRVCVAALVLIGCIIAPILASPKFQGAFHFIQEFQGFISPGILSIFLVGLFVKYAPRSCGLVGLILGPVIYGVLYVGWHDMAFLNRMTITVAVIVAILMLMTVLKPLKREEIDEMVAAGSKGGKVDMTMSKGSVVLGVVVVILTAALYVFFW